MKQIAIFFTLLFLSFTTVVEAGVLDDFERDVMTPTIELPPTIYDCWPFEDCEADAAEEVVLTPLVFYPREDTELSLASRYHRVGMNLSAYELQIKKVYRQFGVYTRWSKYIESQPADELNLVGLYFLYRPPVQKNTSVELGIGVASMAGNEVSTGSSVYIPVRLQLNNSVAVEFSMTIIALINNILELDSCIVVKQGRLLYSIGYKSLRSPKLNLQGPTVGITYK